MRRHEITAPDAVSQYRDAMARGAPPAVLTPLVAELDPGVVQILHLLREATLAEEMRPPHDFALRLERDLVRTANARSSTFPSTLVERSSIAPRPSAYPRFPALPRGGRSNIASVNGTPAMSSTRKPAVSQGEPERLRWRQRGLGAIASAGMLVVVLVATLVIGGIWRPGAQETTTWQPAARIVTAPAAGRLEVLWESSGGPEGFRRAYGLAIDPEGKIWAVDWPRGNVAILNPDGSFSETWGEPGVGEGQFNFLSAYFGEFGPRGAIDFDSQGNLYIVDTGNFRVQKFAPDRAFLLAWGGKGDGAGQFQAPSGIAIDAAGHVYVSDAKRNDIQVFDGDGAYLGIIGAASEGTAPMTFPVGIAIDDDGNIWVADFGDRVRKFAPDGALLADWGVLGGGEGELTDPSDVAVDAAGRVYVVDQSNRRLQVFSADGRFLARVGGFGAGPGNFSLPASVAIDDAGLVYVSDRDGVQAFRFVMG